MTMDVKTIVAGEYVPDGTPKEVVSPFGMEKIGMIEMLDDLAAEQRSEIAGMPVATSYEKTLESLAGLAGIIEKKSEELSALAAKETGSPIEYHKNDLECAVELLKNLGRIHELEQKSFRYDPKGRCLIIPPANQPIITTIFTVATALLYGNKVTFRPSSRTPMAANEIIRAFYSCGIPPESLALLASSNRLTEELIRSKAFDAVISFASNAVNAKIAIFCAESDTELHAENEGYDWAYVDSSLPFETERAADLLIESMIKHNGQMCDSIRGIAVHRDIYDDLKHKLVAKLSRITAGNPLDSENRLGSLLRGTGDLADAYASKIHSSSTLLLDKAPLQLFEITGLSDEICSQAPFAPIIWLYRSEHPEHIIEKWNDANPYGLGFSIYSSNKEVQSLFAGKIRAGRININGGHADVGVFDPWGGVRRSGFGGPQYWFELFTNRKFISHG